MFLAVWAALRGRSNGDFETAEIVEQAEDRIAIEADVILVESWRDTLVLVREDGIWRLTDSYYAKQE